jgi:hypothetical protein
LTVSSAQRKHGIFSWATSVLGWAGCRDRMPLAPGPEAEPMEKTDAVDEPVEEAVDEPIDEPVAADVPPDFALASTAKARSACTTDNAPSERSTERKGRRLVIFIGCCTQRWKYLDLLLPARRLN